MTEKRLLWLSDSPFLETGYSNISKQICNRLSSKGWKIQYIGSNYMGQTLEAGIKIKGGHRLDFEVLGQGKEGYGKDIIKARINEFRPHIFVTLLDTFMVFPWWAEIDYSPAKPVFYFPSDGGGGIPYQCEHVLMKCAVPVAMSEYGQKQVKDYYNINSAFIPHAVDTQKFRPVDKNKAKARFGVQGRFVVGVVARNQPRKMLDRTLKAFSVFCKDKPDAVLLLHTDPNDSAAVFDMRVMCQRLGIINRVVFTGLTFFKAFDYDDMNEVYNAMDVFFLSTSGEGFGIPIIEAMSCSVPVVATNYTTTEELVVRNKAGLAANLVGCEDESIFSQSLKDYDLKVVDGTITGSWMVERGMVSIVDAAKCLSDLYSNPTMLSTMGTSARQACIDKYEWTKVADQWDELLTGLIEW